MVTPISAITQTHRLAASGDQGRDQSALSFGELLQQAFQSANRAQLSAEHAAQLLATGQVEDVHQVTILTEKANLSLQLMISIRNKLIDAYQEISRMQV